MVPSWTPTSRSDAMRSTIPINPDQDEALRRLQSAYAAFPRSPAIGVTMGNVYRRWEEWSDALIAYDAVLARIAERIPRR